MRAKPPTISLASVKGPSVTLNCAVGHADACAECAGQAAFGGEEDAGLEGFFDELSHLGHLLLSGRGALGFGGFVEA